MTFDDHFLCLVPITELHRRLEIRAMMTVQICEDTILVLQTTVLFLGSTFLDSGEGASGVRRWCSRSGI
jgi:hypothetical protein